MFKIKKNIVSMKMCLFELSHSIARSNAKLSWSGSVTAFGRGI